jgi:hypothetical protein
MCDSVSLFSLNNRSTVRWSYRCVSAKEGLEEGRLPSTPWPDHLTKEHWPLSLALLQVHSLLPRHCRGTHTDSANRHTHTHRNHREYIYMEKQTCQDREPLINMMERYQSISNIIVFPFLGNAGYIFNLIWGGRTSPTFIAAWAKPFRLYGTGWVGVRLTSPYPNPATPCSHAPSFTHTHIPTSVPEAPLWMQVFASNNPTRFHWMMGWG